MPAFDKESRENLVNSGVPEDKILELEAAKDAVEQAEIVANWPGETMKYDIILWVESMIMEHDLLKMMGEPPEDIRDSVEEKIERLRKTSAKLKLWVESQSTPEAAKLN